MTHPATIPEKAFLRECEIAGGGLTHGPTGASRSIHAHATERERRRVVWRLRLLLAATVRTPFDGDGLATAWWRDPNDPTRLRPDLSKHRDFPAFAALALDALAHRDWRLKGAAGVLGVRPWCLHRAVSCRVLLREFNARRAERGLRALSGARSI